MVPNLQGMAFVPFKRKQDHHITGISCSINPFIAPTKPEKGDSCNLTLRATAGLRYVNRIVFMAQQTTNALSNQGKKLVNTQMSSINENMNMNRDAAAMNTLPILNARYRPLAFLGKGTFSQLIVAEDLYHPSKKHFAVKIMNPHCDYIGIQECQKIHVLNTIDPDGGCRVVKYISCFYFKNHFCIVLELLGCSLLQFSVNSFTLGMIFTKLIFYFRS